MSHLMCYLIVYLGTEWSSPAIDFFEELCHTAKWKAIMARVIESKPTVYGSKLQCVQLIDTNESTVSIAPPSKLIFQYFFIRVK